MNEDNFSREKSLSVIQSESRSVEMTEIGGSDSSALREELMVLKKSLAQLERRMHGTSNNPLEGAPRLQWRRHVSEDGFAFYYNESTGATQWEQPAAE